MANEWREMTLGEVSESIEYGFTASATEEVLKYRFLRITDIQGGAVKWKEVPYCEISDAEAIKYKLRFGDIVVARTGNSTGENYLFASEEDAIFASYLIRFRISGDYDAKFIWYQLRTEKWREFISGAKTGSAQAGANANVLRRFELSLPPLPIQRQIAAILSAFDDKIELNRQMNRTLEQMARALFKSWFVDFDPVRAKMRGEQPEGMDAATAALFPSELVEVDGREVPKGWDIVKARYFAEISIGKTPPRKEPEWFSFEQGHRVWVSIKDMGSQGVYISDSSEYLTEEAVNKFNIKRVPNNSVLLSFKLTIGRVKITRGETFTNEAIAHFSLNEAYKSTYCYFLLSNYDFSSLGSTSSIATAVNSQIIKDMPLLMPPNKLLMAFDDAVSEIMQRIEVGEDESARLASLRDALLPRLLSGEVDVSEWEGEA